MNSVNDVIGVLVKDIFAASDTPTIIKKCIMCDFPKEDLAEYVTENNIDEMVVGTRGKSGIVGFFSSSFAEYMVRHAHCSLRVIRAD